MRLLNYLIAASAIAAQVSNASPMPGGNQVKETVKTAVKTAEEKLLETFFGMNSTEISCLLKSMAVQGEQEIQEAKKFITCEACSKGVGAFTAALKVPNVVTALGNFACKTLKLVQPTTICDGLLPQFIPWFKEVLDDKRFQEPQRKQLCHNLAKLCPSNPATFVPDFAVPKALAAKIPRNNKIPAATGRKIKYVAHISDIHMDVGYTVGAEGACKSFLCCRPDSTDGTNTGVKQPCAKFGSFLADAPQELLRSTMRAITNAVPKLDMLLLSGDLVPHNLFETTKDGVFRELGIAVDLIKGGIPKSTQVIPAVGNHDSSPANYFAPTENPSFAAVPQGSTYAPAKDTYSRLADLYSDWLPAQALESVKQRGLYSHSPSKGLRVLTLSEYFYYFDFGILFSNIDGSFLNEIDTNYCYNNDFFTYVNYFNPNVDNVLSWIVGEIQKAQANKEAVWIM
ncbi:hypothetical protein HDU97_008994, partial [Phlyctochytrium planicorne]